MHRLMRWAHRHPTLATVVLILVVLVGDRRLLDRVASRRLRRVDVLEPEEGRARERRAGLVARPLLRRTEADARGAGGRRPRRRLRLRQLPQPREPARPVRRAALRLSALDRGEQPPVRALVRRRAEAARRHAAPGSASAESRRPSARTASSSTAATRRSRCSARPISSAARSRRCARCAGSASLRKPTLDVSPLADCVAAKSPFEPVASRLARLGSKLHLPIVSAGPWFNDGQRINAEAAGSALVLEYASCGSGTTNGDCGEVLSISSEPFDANTIGSELAGADCEQTTVAGVPAVIWNANSRGASAAGVIVFTDHATISLANQLNLYPIDLKGLRRVTQPLRPVAPRDHDAAGAELRRAGAPAPLREADVRPELERALNGFVVRRLELIPEVRLERIGAAVAALWPALPELDFVNRIYGLEDAAELAPFEALYAAAGRPALGRAARRPGARRLGAPRARSGCSPGRRPRFPPRASASSARTRPISSRRR